MSSSAARAAYQTFEPYHLVAYFNPELGDASAEVGLDGHAWYAGSRGAPLGPCAPSVVAAVFFNFNPELIDRSWPAAVEAGLDRVEERRWLMLDSVLGGALGSAAADPALEELARTLHDLLDQVDYAGRPLAAAWHASPFPPAPHLAFWHATAVLREWRGDGHLTALVDAGFGPTDAVVFHEAVHPDPRGRRVLGKRLTQVTRSWSDEEWGAAADRLASRGLLSVDGEVETLTAAGVELDQRIEDRTDALAGSVWAGSADPEAFIASARPYVKAVISAGILPGTRR